MLTHISIENFKGIGERVEIELKPITLLFGPNSAGKSTILHALLYAQEVFERHNLNADTTAAGGPFINLGGFKRMVHGHDLTRKIRLGFRYNLDEDDFPPYEHDANAFEIIFDSDYERIIDKPKSAGVFVEIGCSEYGRPAEPVVESCVLQLNEVDFAEITFDAISHRRALKLLTLDHPVFRQGSVSPPPLQAHFPWTTGDEEGVSEVSSGKPLFCADSPALLQRSLFHSAFDMVGSLMRSDAEGRLLLPSHPHDDALPRPDASIGPVETRCGRDVLSSIEFRSPRCRRGKGRPPRAYVESDATLPASLQRIAFDIAGLLDKITTNTIQALRRRLQTFSYLGPVREIPPRNMPPPETPDPSRWSTGLGAWDRLQTCDAELVHEVSDWLSGPTRLNAGVRLSRRELIPLDKAREILADLSSGRPSPKRLNAADERLASLPTEKQLFLIPNESQTELGLHDVGVGFSQLVPVVVTALDSKGRMAGIEAPEYHLHPRLQAELGDLLIESALGKKAILLVETHSEHLILRLQRRIREKAAVASLKTVVTADLVAVYHVNSKNGQTKVTEMHLDQNGDFMEPWPDDFFEIDFYERFSDVR